MSVLIPIVFITGALVGAVLLVAYLNYSVDREDAKRRMARAEAEQRIHDAQTSALMAMADATERAVMSNSSVRGWPSESPGSEIVDGTIVTVTTAED